MEKLNLADKFNQKINLENTTNKTSKQKEKTPINFSGKTEKMIIAGIGGLALIGMASIAMYKKGVSLDIIKFGPNGTALKNGKKFSGIVSDTLTNGDKIKLKYKNGELISSQRTGVKNFTKKYEIINGEKIVTTTTENKTDTININQLKQQGIIKKESITRAEAERAAQIKAQNAQNYYNKPFNEALSNKSAEESAQIMEEQFQNEAILELTQRAKAEQQTQTKAQIMQNYYNKPFDEALSNKSAEESAKNMEALLIEQANIKAQNAQNYYNKPFNEALSNKSAEESARILSVENKPNSTITPEIDKNGNITFRKIETKNGIITEESINYDEVMERITTFPDGKTISTSFIDDTKVIDSKNDSGSKYGYKIYRKENGKLKSAGRETVDLENDYRKTVEYLNNDISKTTICQNGEEKIILRDKKGNIINKYTYYKGFGKGDADSLDPIAIKTSNWYAHYAKLCEEFGVPMRPCGVKGGASAHYYELLQNEKGNWREYIQLQDYRSQYDATAKLMQTLRNGNNDNILAELAGIDNEYIDILTNMDTSTLNKLITVFKENHLSRYEIQSIISEISKMLNQKNNFSTENIKETVEAIIGRYSQNRSYVEDIMHIFA